MTHVTDQKQIDAIKEAMPGSRKCYDSLDDAIARLQQAANATENFYGAPIAVHGTDSEGNVDSGIYEGCKAALAYVSGQVDSGASGNGKKQTVIKGVVIFPIPTIESFIDSDAGRNWLEKVAEKEAALVSFRKYRDAETQSEFVNGVAAAPASVQDYITSARTGGGIDTDTFDALWSDMRAELKKAKPGLVKFFPPKGDFLKCIRSKEYAENLDDGEYKPLEERGIFVGVAKALIEAAKNNTDKDGNAAPMDTTSLENWLSNRDSLVLTPRTEEEKDFSSLDEMDLSDIM